MAEHGSRGTDGGSTGLLTPVAAGIAGLIIATLSLLANGSWTYVVQGWINRNGSGSFSDTVALTGVAQGVLAAGALFLAGRARLGEEPIARHLGGATVVVGGVGLLVAVLTVLAGLAGF
ncbi:hypothetical protein [Nocardioides sp.]|uniref:hypothetical protein n=1 Tax=Nocardioides sp. TaxID=35761 RepID=UPI0025CD755D|nr:hypothetical protein [Nocardioides sp.]